MADNIEVERSGDAKAVSVATSEEASGIHYPQYILMGRNGDGDLEEIKSLRGAINVHDADPHRAIFNQFLHYDTATVTTLDTALSIGDNTVDFNDITGFSPGDEIKIENGSTEPLFFTVLSFAGNVATIDTPVTFSHPVGSSITKVYTNMAQTGLTTTATPANPIIFTTHIPAGFVVHAVNMSVVMTDNAAMDFTTFAGATALTSGIVHRAQINGVVGTFTNWKQNLDLDSDAFPVRYQEKVGGGEFGLSALYNIKDSTESIIFLDGDKGDKFEILIQDDLTGASKIKMKLQGHYEGL
jgi:hypothetical protein